MRKEETLVDVLVGRAQSQPEASAFTFLEQGAEKSVSYAELDHNARKVASMLLGKLAPGSRVVLLYPPGHDYIQAFYGCLYAGIIAVPLYPPRLKQRTDRIEKVIANCGAQLSLCNGKTYATIQEFFEHSPELDSEKLANTEDINEVTPLGTVSQIHAEDIAYLQYTSGSTGVPKGVMISHANVMANVRVLEEATGSTCDDVFVNWLPLFHDFGLVAALLWPVYQGVHSVMMAPVSFVQRPARWLDAITRFRGTISCAPNFAYELCIDKVRDADIATFDLSSWRAALNGAEPVNSDIIDAFSRKFVTAGFRRETFLPCYGMAEVTLFLTGGDIDEPPVIKCFHREELQKRRVVPVEESHPSAHRLVACGKPTRHHQLRIANPDTREELPENCIGEIWIGGPSVADGYWEMPEASRQTFRATLGDTDEDPFLRSGDLGFLHEGEIYISGRIKDIFIIRGRNYYPQDIELLSQRSHPGLRSSSCAAFTIERNGSDRVMVVQEIEPRAAKNNNMEEMVAAIRAAVLEEFDLPLEGVILIRPGTIPKTSSGKIQRTQTREQFLADDLQVLWKSTPTVSRKHEIFVAPQTPEEQQLADIWQEVLGHSPISVTANFFEQGGHSLLATELVARLRRVTSRDVRLSLLLECQTIERMAARLDSLDAATDAPPQLITDSANRYEPFLLTDVQEAYWLGRREDFMLGGVGVHGYAETHFDDLDVTALERAWNQLIHRHDMLRMIVTPDGQQRVLAEVPEYRIDVADLRGKSKDAVDAHLEQMRAAMSHQCYSGEQWPLFDIRVTLQDDAPAIMHVSIDALPLDLSSIGILSRELSALYANSHSKLPSIGIQFRDYVLAEKRSQASDTAARDYWLSRLPDFPGGPDLPLAIEPADIGAPRFERRAFELGVDAWKILKEIAARFEISPNVLIAGAFSEVLRQWSRHTHYALNLTLFNRPPMHPDIRHVVGDFTTLLLLETGKSPRSVEFATRLQQLQRQLWIDLEHRDYNAVHFQQAITQNRGGAVSYPVVLTSALGVQEQEDISLPFNLYRDILISQTPQVWLDFQVSEVEGALSCNWDSVEGLFPAGMLDAMFGAFTGLLERLAEDESLWTASDLVLLPERDQALIETANDTAAPVPQGLLHEPLLERLITHAERDAVVTSTRTLSYRELGLASQYLADCLKAGGAQPNRLIAVVMEKGWEQVVAVLGILRAGAAYLPIDAALPAERIHQLLQIGEVTQVVTVPAVREAFTFSTDIAVTTVNPELLSASSELTPVTELPCQSASDLAYVIFTSGSTGTPKGVMIDHRGALNTVVAINTRFQVTEADTVLGLSNLSFDLSVYDIFGVLGVGGRLVLPAPEERRDPDAWLAYVHEHKVTVWNTVPALMQMLVEYAESQQQALPLTRVMMSGDWIPTDLPARIKACAPDAQIISLGGATEASIWSIYYPIDEVNVTARSVPYGKALANQQFYVLDTTLSPTPVWVPGELYIGGIGLALGYWKDEAKTQTSFITHPRTGERLYRTGDLGRLLPDGNIEFLGREDGQVKVQGYRIELGEIETRLKQHPKVRDAVVTTFNAGNTKQLIAYVVTEDNQRSDTLEVGVENGNVLVDPMERRRFIIEKHALRRDLEGKVLPLAGKSETLELHQATCSGSFSGAALSLQQLGALLAVAAEHRFDSMPVPKYFYPSAGGLYPVQIYLSVPETASNEISAGAYYYDPASHSLVRTGAAFAVEDDIHASLHLIADLAAIEPMYGDHAEEFCYVEAGYLAQLFGTAGPVNLKLQRAECFDGNAIRQAFKLADSHLHLCAYRVDTVLSSAMHTCTLELAARKSYRRFEPEAVSRDDFLTMLAPMVDADILQLDIVIWIRQDRVDGMCEGCYRLDAASGDLKSLACDLDVAKVFALSDVIHEQAGFAIFLAGASNGLCDLDGESAQALHEAGYAAQALMNSSTNCRIGLCAIGIIDQDEFRRAFELPGGKRVVSSFLGGKVTAEQIQRMEISSVPQLDMISVLQEFVSETLPTYMVPSQFVPLERIPLSANGKVDRKALPEPRAPKGSDGEYTPPSTAIEQALCNIWQSVLSVERIGITDNFFDCGGDSIRAIALITRAKAQSIRFSVRDIYTHQTIQALAGVAETGEQENDDESLKPFSLINEDVREQLKPMISSDLIEDAYPLTALQQGMVFHNLKDARRGAYHDVISTRLCMAWNENAFAEALHIVASRHDILRTIFRVDMDPPLQLVLQQGDVQLEIEDLRGIHNDEQAGTLRHWIRSETQRPFDSGRPAWKVTVHRLNDEELQYTLACHHALLDGWSVASFNAEVFEIYNRFLDGKEPRETSAPLSYRQHVANELATRESAIAVDYWCTRLNEARIPWWAGARHGQTLRTGFRLEAEDYDRVQLLARTAGVQERSIFLAAHMRLMALLDGNDDAVSSVVTNCRPEMAGAEHALGLFLNSLPFRINVHGLNGIQLIQEVNRLLVADSEYRLYPLANIQTDTGLDFAASLFTYVNFHVYANMRSDVTALSDDSVDVTNYLVATEVAKNEQARAFNVSLTAEDTIFDVAFMERIKGYYSRIFRQLLDDTETAISNICLIGNEENALLARWNDTEKVFPTDACMHELFEAQVERTPNAVALVFEGRSLTYAELNCAANRLARELLARGIKPDQRVGLHMQRSLEMVIGIYGILKAGAAYVPLDPTYPEARLKHMLASASISLVLSQERFMEALRDTTVSLLFVDAKGFSKTLSRHEDSNLTRVENGADAANLAYVIFTSGSTGLPKGVMVSHRALVNRICWMNDEYKLSAKDTVLQKTPFSFDVSVWEFTWPLMAGGRLVIAKPDGHKDPVYLAAKIREHRVTKLHFVPSMLRIMLEHSDFSTCNSICQVFCSGEELSRDLEKEFFASGTTSELHNLYGPTEAAIDVSYWECSDENELATVPIGRPIANIRLYVCNANQQPLPLGVPGELCIGGIGLARGYINQPELTAERFVQDPNTENRILYRTGDLACYQFDGSIEYLGRIDHQVKIRGFRIELGEIEACLDSHAEVSKSVVVANDAAQLVAYVVQTGRTAEDDLFASLREHLGQSLPEYMIPAIFVSLDVMPLNPNGKLDRKALPSPKVATGNTNYIAPRDEIESALCDIWQRLLPAACISIDADFFHLGGDSLLIMRLAAKIRHEFGVELPVMALFDSPTIAGVATKIRTKNSSEAIIHRLTSGENEEIAVLCVPYAAGDGIVYKNLADAVPEGVGIYSLTNPRNFDPNGDAEQQLEDFMNSCLQEISSRIHVPVIIWGHCVGYSAALNIAGRMLEAGMDVKALCFGGVIIDSRHARRSARAKTRVKPLKDKQVRKLLTSAGLADMKGGVSEVEWSDIIARYRQDMLLSHWSNRNHFGRYKNEPLPIPVYSLVTHDDPLTKGYRRMVRNWLQVGESVSLIEIGVGGHYFIRTRTQAITEFLVGLCDKEGVVLTGKRKDRILDKF